MSLDLRLERVAVIGNGIMGHGIAQVFATAGKQVLVIGRSESSLRGAMDRVRHSLGLFCEQGLLTEAESAAALARITTSTRLADAEGAQLVVEAVPEDTELKLSIFGELDGICPPPAVLASSSGRPASSLVERVRHRERVIAAHFWNPAQLLPLVEVCAGPQTSQPVVSWTLEQLRAAGKAPVLVEREIDGFIGNRLQFALLREALALWADGVASAEAIDTAVKASFGRRLSVTGPLESAELGGTHTMYEFSRYLFPLLSTGEEPPRRLLEPGPYALDEAGRQALLAARYEELFRRLGADRRAVS